MTKSDVNTTLRVSQDDIYKVQEALLNGNDTLPDETSHYFAPGVYARVMTVPANVWVIGKAHREDHISIILKGSCSITGEDGIVRLLEAPSIFVVKGGAKKMAYTLEEMQFVNIHPTDTEDLELIEAKVIIPEEEHRLMIAKDTDMNIEHEAATKLIA